MPRLGARRRLDQQPVEPRTVLLATDGREPLSPEAIERAAALASPDGVAVLAIAKIYGTQFGLPHPGLMPTKLIARVAVARSVQHVVVDQSVQRGVRLMIEGDTGKDVRRRLHGAAEVTVIPRS